jgi:hypothetical protein
MKITEIAHTFGLPTFCQGLRYDFFCQNVLGCILGDFYTTSSGHPG